MRNFVNIGIIIGIVVLSTSRPTPMMLLQEATGIEYLLKSIDAVSSATIPTKKISWCIGSTQGQINGWLDGNGMTLLEERIEDGPGILVVKYFILNNEIVLMQRRYAQINPIDEETYVINDQLQLFEERALHQFFESSFESADVDQTIQLSAYKAAPVRENNFSYEFSSKSCHALMVRFHHEHVFDIISDVEFHNASYHLN